MQSYDVRRVTFVGAQLCRHVLSMPLDTSLDPAGPRFRGSSDALVRAVTKPLDETPLSKLGVVQWVRRAGMKESERSGRGAHRAGRRPDVKGGAPASAGPARANPDAMATRMASTSATILDAFDPTCGFAQAGFK
ncbi:hypothetical protein LGM89_22840 [Burkholderia sp. AU31624]|uniref:hypothetical protein n=1 Tax=Burkholderia sp. AU31624 TaxID=2879629 RepID=UPI001CF53C68|nr:hypothetical protein [Burkholderia sp. AU31624]MCA8256107.1 hypothetical protein [Burkholderia sp. AU31624]